MRRVVALAREEAAASVRDLLDGIPGISARVVTSPGAIPWHDTDCLWVHDLRLTSPDIDQWLAAGGRLLATLEAVRVAVALGLESVPPDDERDSVWERPPGGTAIRGLAAFGAHPLFDGLQRGACTPMPNAGEPYRSASYRASRPREGRAVAVLRTEPGLDPGHIIAWEYAVGRGGVLCIGDAIHPGSVDERGRPQLLAMLGNALAGSGIPHDDRAAEARHWPAPGRQVARHDLAPVPALPALGGAWGEEGAGRSIIHVGPTPEGWRLSGRRAMLVGGRAEGTEELWMHPVRVLSDLSLQVNHHPAMIQQTIEYSDHLERHSRAAEVEVGERWVLALEHPVAYLEVAPAAEVPVLLEWTSDLRRAWPHTAGSAGDLALSVAPDGRRAVLGAAGDPFRLIIDVDGATLEATPSPGPAVRFSLRGVGRCRVRFTGASDEADLERSRQMLVRRHFAGVGRQRVDHARELATYATSIDVPATVLVEGCEWAKLRMDSLLAGAPGIGRGLLAWEDPSSAGGSYSGVEACRLAMAQLVVGDRSSPRDVLKFLSLTQDVDGRIIESCSTAGLARHGVEMVVPMYLGLAAHYAAWTGELDFLSRRWAAVLRALRFAREAGATAPEWVHARVALQPLAEALGHVELAEALAGPGGEESTRPFQGDLSHLAVEGMPDFVEGRYAAGLERMRELAASVGAGRGDARACATLSVLAVGGLWGVRADALAGAVRVAPWFPPDWNAMSIERLRVGRTVLSVRLRRRFGQVAARVERVHGPRIHTEVILRGAPEHAEVQLDNVVLGGGRAVFEADGSHVIVWNS